jgi:hypothetical protein
MDTTEEIKLDGYRLEVVQVLAEQLSIPGGRTS